MQRFINHLLRAHPECRFRFTWMYHYNSIFKALVEREYDIYLFTINNLIPAGLHCSSQHERVRSMIRLIRVINSAGQKQILIVSPFLKDQDLYREAKQAGVVCIDRSGDPTETLFPCVSTAVEAIQSREER